MRNTWTIIQREYLERVRTRSFLILTLLLPAIMTVLMILPAKLAMMGDKPQHIVLVTTTQQFGDTLKQQLQLSPPQLSEEEEASSESEAKKKPEEQYVIDVDANASDAERAALRDKVGSRTIDGFVWLTDDAIAAHQITWSGRDSASFRERTWLADALAHVMLEQQFAAKGYTTAQAEELLKPIKVDTLRIERGREAKGSGTARALEIVVMVMLLYMAVLLYGISVMRSVLEEKNSRIMEVLLSSATSTELMTGKLLGVGAVGLTQIVAWAVMGGVFALPALAARPNLSDLQVSPLVLVSFAVFFLLGYLLYSTMYAAIGAITTTEQEGQQLQFIVVIPLVLSVFMLGPVIRNPDAPIMMWMSLVPFFAPLVMYARIVLQTPPWWQIALSLGLLIGTIWGLVVLCARIYRIGVLIYGKRPNLPEILKWLKYAKA